MSYRERRQQLVDLIGEFAKREKQINKQHAENLVTNELVKVEPMKLDLGVLFSRGS